MTAESSGSDWNTAIWTNSGTTTPVSATGGNTYEVVSNGVPGTESIPATGAHLRNPLTNATMLVTFPGDSLKLNGNAALWCKKLTSPAAAPILNFPGVNGNPGLILNGGLLYTADSSATFTITGRVQVVSQSYLSGAGGNGPGGYNSSGTCPGVGGRNYTIAAQLSGGGNLVIFECASSMPETISGNSNTFSGKWIVKAGWLLATGTNSLGTNSITIDPMFGLPFDPTTVCPVNGPAILEINYDLNSAGTLTLTNGGQMKLHQNCSFAAVIIEGNSLSAGLHPYSELNAAYPANFPSGGSGGITVSGYNGPPQIVTQPISQSLYAGQAAQFTVSATGTAPLAYQWMAGVTNLGIYTNLIDAGNISGSTTASLTMTNLTLANTADYIVVVTNAIGRATSSVASLTVSSPPPTSTNSIESTLLRLEVATYPFSFRVIEKSTGTVLLQQTTNTFTIGGTYAVSSATNIALSSTTLDADLVLAGTSATGHIQFNFIQPGIMKVALSSGANPTSIFQQFADKREDMLGALETPFGATLSARGYSWQLLGGNGVSGIDQACGAHAPFYLTTRHYGIYVESQANGTMTFAQSGKTSFSFPVAQLTYDIIYGTDYAAIMAGFNNRTAPAFMPPVWALDSWWWNDDDHAAFHGAVTNAQGNVLDRAIQLTNYQIRASAITVDRPYGTSCTQYAGSGGWGNMDFDNSSKGFNDPAGMIYSLHSMGYNMMIWIADECWCGLRAAATNNGWAFFPTNNNTTVDLSNTNAYRWFKTNLDYYVNLGVMGYKIDRGDEGEMPNSVQNVNDNLFAQLSKEGLNAVYPNDWFIYTRSISDIGRQYSAIWNGDTTSLFSGLQYSVISGLRAGILNFPIWGSDTGGYLIGPKQPTEELFDRWLEFSAYCPMMEVLVGGSRTPWYDYSTNFTSPTNIVAIAAAQAAAHHDLIPATRSLLYQATQTGMPVMRPIMFGYPNDTNNAVTITNCEYLYGPNLLVAPVITSNTVTRNVYLPADQWLDYNNKSNLYSGPINITAAAPIQTIPLFVNQGAIIPRGDIWQGNNNWTPNWSPNLRVEFFPMETGGSSFPYYTGGSVQNISCTNHNHTLTVQFGNLGYSGNLQIYLRSPGAVVSNGVTLVAGAGYTYNPTNNLLQVPFNGATTLVVSNAGSLFSPLELWRAAYFGDPSDPNISGDSANPSGDGVRNFLKYAFGLNPLIVATNGLPFQTIGTNSGTNYLALTFQRATNATDCTFTVMVVDDLLNQWFVGSSYSGASISSNTTNTTEISRVLSNNVEIITVRDNTPMAAAPKRFMRVVVTGP